MSSYPPPPDAPDVLPGEDGGAYASRKAEAADIACVDAPDVDLDAMTERALAAARGKWKHCAEHPDSVCSLEVEGPDGSVIAWARRAPSDSANAAHIAGTHPDAVLTLLARLRRAEDALRALSPAR